MFVACLEGWDTTIPFVIPFGVDLNAQVNISPVHERSGNPPSGLWARGNSIQMPNYYTAVTLGSAV